MVCNFECCIFGFFECDGRFEVDIFVLYIFMWSCGLDIVLLGWMFVVRILGLYRVGGLYYGIW